jgi:hypothetical protein
MARQEAEDNIIGTWLDSVVDMLRDINALGSLAQSEIALDTVDGPFAWSQFSCHSFPSCARTSRPLPTSL